MSRMTYLEAIEYVLGNEMEARNDLIVFRPGARHALEEIERDVPLPRLGKTSFAIALGAALTGMHPVLDLRQEDDCAALLLDAVCELPAGSAPVMTVIVGAEDAEMLAELPGVPALCPKTPRQAAGFTRAALRNSQLTLILADRMLFDEEDDVPEERDFVLLPLTDEGDFSETNEDSAAADPEPDCTEEADEQKADEESDNGSRDESVEEAQPELSSAESEAEEPSSDSPEECSEPEEADEIDESEEAEQTPEESLLGETADGCEAEPADEKEASAAPRYVFCATRMSPCDLTRLCSLAGELEISVNALTARCMAHVMQRARPFDWQQEPDAPCGECAFLPPTREKPSLWLGNDRLTMSYDTDQVSHADAAALIRAVRRVLEKPPLLIYDREEDVQ